MNTTSTDFRAGAPRHSRPIRSLSRIFGPIAKPLAGTRIFPLFAVLRHTGRTSGTRYATPVVAFATPDGFMIPLPFGDATQWARNLFAAGGGQIRHKGRDHRVLEPRILDDAEAAAHLPRAQHIVASRVGLRQYVAVRRVSSEVPRL